jgi:hypothetical protein
LFKRPSSNEPSTYDDDIDDGDTPEIDSHSGHDGIYEIAVRSDDNDKFTPVHNLDMEEHPSLTSSAVSSPLPNAISNGHTTVTSPEANSPSDDMPNRVIPIMINSNHSILSPVVGRNITSTINNSTDLPSTLLHPPVQQTLPPLSSVAFFGSGYGGNKQNSVFHLPPQMGSYAGLSPIHKTSLHKNVWPGNSSSSAGATHLQ